MPGARNRPPLEIVPTCELPPGMPLTDHATPVFVVFDTVAVSAVVVPSKTELPAAMTLTLIGAGFAGVPEEFAPVRPPHPPDKTAQNIAISRQGAVPDRACFSARCAAGTPANEARHVPADDWRVPSRDDTRKTRHCTDCPRKPAVRHYLRVLIGRNEFRVKIGRALFHPVSRGGCTVPALLSHFLCFRMGHARCRTAN